MVQAAVLLLVYGGVVHVVHLLASGFRPYQTMPGWLRCYFVSLAVLDPLAAVLLARRLQSGVVLAVGVLVSDAAANGVANYAFDSTAGVSAGRVGQALITALALGGCIVAPQLWRDASRPHRDRRG